MTWGDHGLRVFATGDGPRPAGAGGSVVFDADGRVLWHEPAATRGAFSPDGRVLVTARHEGDTAVDAWFLDAL